MTQKQPISLDTADFTACQQDIAQFDEKRESQIRLCRDIIRLSKKIIYAVHRKDLEKAQAERINIKQAIQTLGHESYDTSMVSVAWQEYVEALAYYEVVLNNKLPTRKELGCSTQHYLLGICDLCGELVRWAVNSAAKGDIGQTKIIKNVIEEIFGQFIQFEFRNSELRKKSDGIKYHLNKVETLLCDLAVRGRH